MTQPEPTGEAGARTIRACLEAAGLNPEDVDYVNAHGTATPQNDPAETAAIKRALGSRARRDPRLLDQVDARPLPLLGRRDRGGRDGPDDRDAASSRPRSTTRSPTPSATSTSSRTWRERCASASPSRTPSPSAGTPRSSRSGPHDEALPSSPAPRPSPRSGATSPTTRAALAGRAIGARVPIEGPGVPERRGPLPRRADRHVHDRARAPEGEGAPARPRQPVRRRGGAAVPRGRGLHDGGARGADRASSSAPARRAPGPLDGVRAADGGRIARVRLAVPLPDTRSRTPPPPRRDRARDQGPERHDHAEGPGGAERPLLRPDAPRRRPRRRAPRRARPTSGTSTTTSPTSASTRRARRRGPASSSAKARPRSSSRTRTSARGRGAPSSPASRRSSRAARAVSPQLRRADPAELAAAMRAALDEAGVAPRDVGLVHLSRNGVPATDEAEDAALAAVFGLAQPPDRRDQGRARREPRHRRRPARARGGRAARGARSRRRPRQRVRRRGQLPRRRS